MIDQEQYSMEIPDYVINSLGAISTLGLKPRNSDIVGKYARHSEVTNMISGRIFFICNNATIKSGSCLCKNWFVLNLNEFIIILENEY